MDKEVHLSQKKRLENVLFTLHCGVLTALIAIAPLTNGMMAQNKFSSLSDNINRGLAWLATMSNSLNYRQFENVFKSVTTDATKKRTDNTGKEFTLFLALEPIKRKPLDKSQMFGGQLPYLFKQEETSTKSGKH